MIGLEGIHCLITRPLAESGGNTYSYEWSGGNPLSNYPEQKVGGGGRSLSVMNFTVMFVPKTQDSTLIDMLQKTENDLKVMTGWSTKLTEKPGVPLLSLLIKAFPVEDPPQAWKVLQKHSRMIFGIHNFLKNIGL